MSFNLGGPVFIHSQHRDQLMLEAHASNNLLDFLRWSPARYEGA